MAKKPVITNVDSGFSSQSALNANFQSLQNGFDNTLSLDGSVPNALQADLDINGNSVINAGIVETDTLILNGVALTPSNAAGAALTSLTAFGGSLIDDADNLEALGTLGLSAELQSVTATAAELNTLDGFTGTTVNLNVLSGTEVTPTEFNYIDGVTSSVQEQLDALAASIVSAVPSGTIIQVAQNTAPAGYLKANGSAVSREDYADLFAAIGTTYGSGNGSTTFNVPDLRGEFVRGWDDGRGVDSGRGLGSSQSAYSTVTVPRDGWGTSGSALGAVTSGRLLVGSGQSEINEGLESIRGAGSDRTATSTSNSNRPRNVALLYCIKV